MRRRTDGWNLLMLSVRSEEEKNFHSDVGRKVARGGKKRRPKKSRNAPRYYLPSSYKLPSQVVIDGRRNEEKTRRKRTNEGEKMWQGKAREPGKINIASFQLRREFSAFVAFFVTTRMCCGFCCSAPSTRSREILPRLENKNKKIRNFSPSQVSARILV